MDKYTVDLDKVLNDFEYSELTDQYVRQSNASQSHSFSSAKARGGNVKHSITNVFHSLNEYLNTEVGDKCEIVSEITTQQNDSFKSPFTITADDLLKEPPVVHKLEPEDNNVASTSLVIDRDVQNISEKAEAVIDLTEIKVAAVEAKSFAAEESSLPETDNNLVLIDDVKEDSALNTLSASTTQEKAVESSVAIVEQITEKHNDAVEQVVESINIVDNQHVEESLTDSFVNENKSDIPIGFDDTFELDESELNKYLDELENELDIPKTEVKDSETKEGEKQEEKKNVQYDDHREEQEKETTDNESEEIEEQYDAVSSLPRPMSLELPVELTENKRNINLIGNSLLTTRDIIGSKNLLRILGNPGSTPYNNMYQEKKPDINESSLEHSSSPSPTFSDISTDSCGSTTPSTETVNEDEPYPNRYVLADKAETNRNTGEIASSEHNADASGFAGDRNQLDDNAQVNLQNDVNENNDNENNVGLSNDGAAAENVEESSEAMNNEEVNVENNQNLDSAEYNAGPGW